MNERNYPGPYVPSLWWEEKGINTMIATGIPMPIPKELQKTVTVDVLYQPPRYGRPDGVMFKEAKLRFRVIHWRDNGKIADIYEVDYPNEPHSYARALRRLGGYIAEREARK